MMTPIYIKMGAPELLLLSEGMWRQLGIISYHPDEQISSKLSQQEKAASSDSCTVSTVRVHLIQDIRLLPDECVTTQVKLEGALDVSNTQPSLTMTS